MIRTAVLLVCILAAATATAQPVKVIEPVKVAADGGGVTFVEFGPMTVVYTEHTGPYTGIGKAIGTLMTQVKTQKIDVTGPVMGIYHNSPDMVPENELRWDVAVQVPEGTEVAEPLMVRVIPPSTVARLAYRGAPDKLSAAYGRLMAAVNESGHEPVGPAIEIYNGIPSGRIIDCTINFVVAAPGAHEPGGIGAELVIPGPMFLVFVEYTGSFSQIGPATEAFLTDLGDQGIEPAGPVMYIFLNDPADTPEEALHWRVAVPIDGERDVTEPLMAHGVPERIVARGDRRGVPPAGRVRRGARLHPDGSRHRDASASPRAPRAARDHRGRRRGRSSARGAATGDDLHARRRENAAGRVRDRHHGAGAAGGDGTSRAVRRA
jgi:effector-binding domain-containing protein